MKKAIVAMSGGVDSSVAALILKQQNYEVCGITLKLFANEDVCVSGSKTCCSVTDVLDAKAVAHMLGIPHYVLNFKDKFIKEVITRFVNSYISGNTPNPCIDCNKYIKFKELLNRAVILEQDYLATGHYAKSDYDRSSGRYLLKKPVDRAKDQTYVLYGLAQEQLAKTLFPLGDYKKSEIREIAKDMSLKNASKPDSQDICFVPDGNYAKFIEDYTTQRMCNGDFIDKEGSVVAKHKGMIHYTIGQRKGLGAFSKPMYVLDKDIVKNTVTIGDESDLYSKQLIAEECNLIPFETLNNALKVNAKIRYKQREEKAIIHPMSKDEILVEFLNPQRAITPGQAVVFYDGEVVVGGGTIKNIRKGVKNYE